MIMDEDFGSAISTVAERVCVCKMRLAVECVKPFGHGSARATA